MEKTFNAEMRRQLTEQKEKQIMGLFDTHSEKGIVYSLCSEITSNTDSYTQIEYICVSEDNYLCKIVTVKEKDEDGNEQEIIHSIDEICLVSQITAAYSFILMTRELM